MTQQRLDEYARSDDARDDRGDRGYDTGRAVDHRPVPGAFGQTSEEVGLASTVDPGARGAVDAAQTEGSVHHPVRGVSPGEDKDDGPQGGRAGFRSRPSTPAQPIDRRPSTVFGHREGTEHEEGPTLGRGPGRQRGADVADVREPLRRRRPERNRLKDRLRRIPNRLLERLVRRPTPRMVLRGLTNRARAFTRGLERLEAKTRLD